jgi:hypothetical protein
MRFEIWTADRLTSMKYNALGMDVMYFLLDIGTG